MTNPRDTATPEPQAVAARLPRRRARERRWDDDADFQAIVEARAEDPGTPTW